MNSHRTLAIVSDIHYACEAERRRGHYEIDNIRNPLVRQAARTYRHFVWQRDPFGHNHLLDRFIAAAGVPDLVIANGDYSCDSAFVGVSDDAACQSASECLAKLRRNFGGRFQATIGDHELGKTSLAGGAGGMRLASWRRAREELGLTPFWRVDLDRYVLMGVVSSLVALPVFEIETLPDEREEWRRLRAAHLEEIRDAFASVRADQRILLFCHDPTALPFLWREEAVRARLPLIEQTVIGHLHSSLVLWSSRLLAGLPPVRFLGNSIRRMSTALNEARHWQPFNVRLCRSLSGIELLKDGGSYEVKLGAESEEPAKFRWRALGR